MRMLPPLNGLKAFEAAARHLSFTRAAEELFVTPAAISHQIKGLEDFLGVILFRRLPRAVLLTDEAQLILPLISEAFDKFAQAGMLLKESESTGVLTVSSAPTFAQKWLLEHLDDFTALYPDINVRLDARLDTVDFDRDGVDVAIRLGAGKYPGMRVDQLFDEQVVPICHPKFLEGPNALRHPEDLRHHTLLHVDWGNINALFPDWRMWLTSVGVEGVDFTRGPVFTVESMAIAAAVRGTGIALGSTYAIQEELQSGQLVVPFARKLTSEISYWVVAPERSADQPKVRAFREWLLRRARETGLSGG